jgi:hypothetical protein
MTAGRTLRCVLDAARVPHGFASARGGRSWQRMVGAREQVAGPEPLAPLQALVALEYLGLPNFFTIDRFARLAARLPQARGPWLAAHACRHRGNFTCRKCRQRATVFTAGRPMRSLCPACDSESLTQHVPRHRTAQQAAIDRPTAA